MATDETEEAIQAALECLRDGEHVTVNVGRETERLHWRKRLADLGATSAQMRKLHIVVWDEDST